MKRHLLIGIITASFLIAGCGRTSNFAVGFQGGTYENIVKSLDGLPGLSFKIINSSGCNDIINSVNEGKAEFGIVQLDILADVLNKEGSRAQNVKFLMPLYIEEVHLIADKKIKSIDDLNGKTISAGGPNSGSAVTAQIILNQLGLGREVKELVYLEPAEGLAKLQEGKIDALFILSASPVELLAALPKEFGDKYHLLVFNNERYDKITADQYNYQKAVIRKNDYRWLDGDVKTIAVISSFIINKNVPDKEVTNFIKTIFSNLEELEKKHPKWKELDEDEIAWYLKNYTEQFHPAAKRALQSPESM